MGAGLPATFDLHDPLQPSAANHFRINTVGEQPETQTHCSTLIAPGPKATIWSSPPAIITSFRKWIIWFWSANWLWNETATGAALYALALPALWLVLTLVC